MLRSSSICLLTKHLQSLRVYNIWQRLLHSPPPCCTNDINSFHSDRFSSLARSSHQPHRVRPLHTSCHSYSLKKEKKQSKKSRFQKSFQKAEMGVVEVANRMTVAQLAAAMGKSKDHVHQALGYNDKYSDDDAVLDSSLIAEVVKKSGLKMITASKSEAKGKTSKDAIRQPPADPASLVSRPAVVTIMGHVDHGKTTLLDTLRASNVVDQEFGGITQHIGAFSVRLPSGETITFLDTPGHAAFSAMRARGASLTDIVVLVVAADDGVMNQTVESIEHAKSAGVPIIVAINKIDRPNTDIENVKRELTEQGLMVEDMGGEIQAVPISALKGTNVLELQEAIVALAEVLELKSDPEGLIEGHVVEAKIDPGRGKLATVLVQRGTLKKGACLVAGTAWAKVRSMFNDKGNPTQKASPSTPVEIIGWRELPSAGDEILQVESESRVKEVIQWRLQQKMLEKADTDQHVITEKRDEHDRVYHEGRQRRLGLGIRYKRRPQGPRPKESAEKSTDPQLAIIIKGDVDGTVEAILDTLDTYNSTKCQLNLVHYGVGDVNENDLDMAKAFDAVVYGFNVKVADTIKTIAANDVIEIQQYNVIYKLFENILEKLNERLPPAEEEEIIGEANVLEVFTITEGRKKLPVAGCRCVKGMLSKKKYFRIIRNWDVIYDGTVTSMKHFKNEVESVKKDVECGLSFEDKTIEFLPGDTITCYQMKEVKQHIDWDLGF